MKALPETPVCLVFVLCSLLLKCQTIETQLALTVDIFLLLVNKLLCMLRHFVSMLSLVEHGQFDIMRMFLCHIHTRTFCRRKLCRTKSLIDSLQKFIVFYACSVELCIIWINYWLCNCMGSSLFLASNQFVHHQFHDRIVLSI